MAQKVKNLPILWRPRFVIPGLERLLRREWLPASSILGWRIHTEKPGGSQRVGHDLVANSLFLDFFEV